jgi:acyl-CoA thioester hydrolase
MLSDPTGAFTQTVRVRYEECGPGGHVRASVYMRYLQDLAFAHSAALGYPLAWYEAHRLFWLVRRVRLVVGAPAAYGEELHVTTQVAGMRRVLARRWNTIRRSGDDGLVATAMVDWIFTQDGTAPLRVPDEVIKAFPAMGTSLMPLPLPELPAPHKAVWRPLRIRASDADAMDHANNAVYIDLLDDAVLHAGGRSGVAAHPRTYDLQYHAAAATGAVLRDAAWRDGATWHYRLESMNGLLHLHGRLEPRGEAFEEV